MAGVLWCITGMSPDETAEIRSRLLDFATEMLGGLARKDQRAAGELYVRGLLTDGQRTSPHPHYRSESFSMIGKPLSTS